jgi:hypothetical protein
MTRATSSISSSSFRAIALAAAAALAVELALARTGFLCGSWFSSMIRPLPHWIAPSVSRDSYFDDCRIRRCRESGRPPVVFLGSSPVMGLDLEHLDKAFGDRGMAALVWAYSSGFYPLELLSMLDDLRGLRPRAVALCLGPPSFAPYSGLRGTRLAYFPLKLPVLRRLPGGAWRHERLLARALLANTVAAFRYHFLFQDELFPGWPGAVGPSRNVLDEGGFAAAASELSMTRDDGIEALEAFLSAWRTTGIPLVVWDAPRTDDPSVPGRPLSKEGERAYRASMRALSRAYGFRFIGAEELPRFAPAEFANVLHLKDAGRARLTRFLVREIERSL